jgi:hypothetical protein
MEATKPQVASSWNIRARPDDVSMESEKPLCPLPPPSDGALKLKFIGLKEDLLVRTHVPWDFVPIERREDRVADTDRLRGLNRAARQVSKKAVPVPVIDAD